MHRLKTAALCATLCLLVTTFAYAGSTVTIVNGNAPGVGFNDPTAATPVGGNTGTTVGQQRLIAFQHAAAIWGATLDSAVEIKVLATFEPQACTASSAVLGSAGSIFIFSDTPNVEYANTWYHSALANKLSGTDLLPAGAVTSNPTGSDIRARFNVNLGNSNCLAGSGWYYGLDGNHGPKIDLVAVLLHEFAHGLGFSQFASVSNGSQISNRTDVYGRQLLDLSTGKRWNQMTNAERAASAINSRKVVWTGRNVSLAVPTVLSPGVPLARINQPAAMGTLDLGAASFGPALTAAGVTGDVALAIDAANTVGPSTTDGCSTITSDVAGKIALIDRGTCGFVLKVKNAQIAGAIGVLIGDNVAGGPPAGLGGVDATITIPSGRVTLADANALKSALGAGTLNATLLLDMTRLAGADGQGRALMNAPNPVQPGSSISHWDPITFRNQLMEPSINGDLTHSVKAPEDLSTAQMTDIGWFSDYDGVPDAVDQCLGSSQSATWVINGCDSGAPNLLFSNGCKLSDYTAAIATASTSNHGQFVSNMAHFTNLLRDLGHITGAQKGSVQSCAAK